MSYEEYEALPGLRSSELSRARISMLHYRRCDGGPDTPARQVLRAIHCRILEPARFSAEYGVYDGMRRGKLYTAWCAGNPGKVALKPAEYNKIQRTAEAVLHHPVAGPMLSSAGQSEVVVSWEHPGTMRHCKGRIDRWVPGGVRASVRGKGDLPVLVDLKGYGTPDPRTIGRMSWDRGAWLQAAHYMEGMRLATGRSFRYLLVVYELRRPHDVAVFELPPADLQLAIVEREALMDRIAECQRTAHWPGCVEGIADLSPPAYVYSDEDEIAVTDEDPDW